MPFGMGRPGRRSICLWQERPGAGFIPVPARIILLGNSNGVAQWWARAARGSDGGGTEAGDVRSCRRSWRRAAGPAGGHAAPRPPGARHGRRTAPRPPSARRACRTGCGAAARSGLRAAAGARGQARCGRGRIGEGHGAGGRRGEAATPGRRRAAAARRADGRAGRTARRAAGLAARLASRLAAALAAAVVAAAVAPRPSRPASPPPATPPALPLWRRWVGHTCIVCVARAGARCVSCRERESVFARLVLAFNKIKSSASPRALRPYYY